MTILGLKFDGKLYSATLNYRLFPVGSFSVSGKAASHNARQSHAFLALRTVRHQVGACDCALLLNNAALRIVLRLAHRLLAQVQSLHQSPVACNLQDFAAGSRIYAGNSDHNIIFSYPYISTSFKNCSSGYMTLMFLMR